MANTHIFSKEEELANSITHGIAAVLSAVALVVLIKFSVLYGNVWHIVSFTIFGTTMLFLYLSSTIVHSLPEGKVKDIFQVIDHSAIYFFIAGTYTPYLFIVVRGWQGWSLFGVIWGMAILGTIFKYFFVKKYLFTSTILYIIMGWLLIIVWNPIIERIALGGVILLGIGGIFYTLGSIFYIWRGFKYHHAVWHLFVIAGSTCHFFGIIVYLLQK